jgi:hypothetical protein
MGPSIGVDADLTTRDEKKKKKKNKRLGWESPHQEDSYSIESCLARCWPETLPHGLHKGQPVQSIAGYMTPAPLLQSSPDVAAHTYNPSYLGGRDQEDQGLKPAQAKSSMEPISSNGVIVYTCHPAM